MSPSRTHRIVAFALSLAMTLTLFSGVISLASKEHTSQWLVQQTTAPSQRG